MNERYLQQALSAISVRRNNAQTIQQQHLAEIAQTVPEIMEINHPTIKAGEEERRCGLDFRQVPDARVRRPYGAL